MTNLKNSILDIIFPRRCLGCNTLITNELPSYVCPACLKTIPFVKGFACAFCKSPVKAGKTCAYCVKDHFLDRLLVTASYEDPLIEKMVKAVKYRFVSSLANTMADLMIKYLKNKAGWLVSNNVLTVIPVALHRRRLNWRGFNQAEIMAKKIGEFFGWPVDSNVLQRIHNLKPQADMPDKLSRIENMRNVFACNLNDQQTASMAERTILLVDDLSTTGSTLNDCAHALKGAGLPAGQAGTREVIGFVFARGKLEKNSSA